jgi:hypothetical protein
VARGDPPRAAGRRAGRFARPSEGPRRIPAPSRRGRHDIDTTQVDRFARWPRGGGRCLLARPARPTAAAPHRCDALQCLAPTASSPMRRRCRRACCAAPAFDRPSGHGDRSGPVASRDQGTAGRNGARSTTSVRYAVGKHGRPNAKCLAARTPGVARRPIAKRTTMDLDLSPSNRAQVDVGKARWSTPTIWRHSCELACAPSPGLVESRLHGARIVCGNGDQLTSSPLRSWHRRDPR